MKKLLSGIACITMLMSVLPIHAAEPEVFVNSGIIEINDKITDAVLNDEITVNVVKSDFDWDTESEWDSENYQANYADIKYYDIIKTDPNGKYSIKFMLDEMGKYTIYLGSEYYSEPYIKEFYYTNKSAQATAVEELNNAASAEAAAEVIKDNRYALMLYSDKYSEADLDEAGKLVYEYISEQNNDLDAEEATNAVYMGMMVNFLNTRDIKDAAEYSDCLGMSGSSVGKYWSDSFGASVASDLEKEAVNSISEYDEKMFYATAGCIIEKNDGKDGIKAVLEEHMERTGSGKSVTDAMCSEAAGKKLYSKDALSNWTNGYQEPGSGNGSRPVNGGSSSGGGYNTEHYNAAAGSSFNVGFEQTEQAELAELDSIFADLNDAEWAREAIEALYSKGIIAGRTERSFAPNDTVLREEFVKLLMSTFNLNLISDDMAFTDVDKNAWYYKYVNCAYASGIAQGFSDDIFGIGENITRQDICVMIDNTLKLCEIYPDEIYEAKEFTDASEIADYAKEAVARMQRLGVVNGYEDGSFNPTGTATRAEAAKIMYAIYAYVANGGAV